VPNEILGLPAAFILPDTLSTAELLTVRLLPTITLFEKVALAAVMFEPILRLDADMSPERLILPKPTMFPSTFKLIRLPKLVMLA
jgi:hypothetical protein